MRWSLLVLAPCLVIGLSCNTTTYYTTYYNFEPQSRSEPSHSGAEPKVPQYWRSFWVYGWFPGEIRIDAARSCGGIEHVKRLETGQTFVQGLLAGVARHYINIYSPYSARVVCDHSRLEYE
jgi:hypothetical protein